MNCNFTRIRDCHNHFTRSSENNFYVPIVKGPTVQSFYYNAIKDWNNLPANLKSLKNSDAFKLGVKDFFI